MDRSQSSFAQELDRPGERAAAAPLSSGLYHTAISSNGLDHLSSLDDVVADRLLDVDILSCLAGQDGHEGVPVIGGGDRHGIDVPVVEHAPEIRFRLRTPPILLRQEGQ